MRLSNLLRSSAALALVLAVAPPQSLSLVTWAPRSSSPKPVASKARGSAKAPVNRVAANGDLSLSAPAQVILAQYAKPQIAQYVQPISADAQSKTDRATGHKVTSVTRMPGTPDAVASVAALSKGAPVRLADAEPQPLAGSAQLGAAASAKAQPTKQPEESSVTPTYSPAKDSEAPPPKPLVGGIGIVQGSGRLVTLPVPVANVFVADPAIAAVRPASPKKLFVFGKSPGLTTLVATDAHGNTVAHFSVSVSPDQYGAVRIKSASHKSAPGSNITVTPEVGGVVVRGTVNTPAEDYKLMQEATIAAGKGGKALNETEVVEPQEVAVKVRIASMSRSVTQQLGINWQTIGNGISIGKFLFNFSTVGNLISAATGTTGAAPGSYTTTFPGNNLDAILSALDTDNLAHILAEPTLTALSGQTASFIDGGQFPVPVPGQNGTVTVEYKSYGVQLKFKPVVLNDGNIALSVAPTVSAPTTQNAFQIAVAGESIVVPSLIEQSASTTVVMGSGQTLAIAGLLYNSSNQTDSAVPGLGSIPVLGSAFRADNYARQEQELVVLVTPYVVKPVNNPNELHRPDDNWRPPNQLQRVLLFQDNGSTKVHATIPGQAGFMVR